eukprot:gene5499-9316_t
MANSELLKAIYSDDVEAVLKIVEEGIHVNVEYEELGFQWKELAYGIESDFYEFIGTDKKYGDTIPLTPLQCASFYGREDIVKIFLSEGGESQQKNSITNETARDIAGHSENHHIPISKNHPKTSFESFDLKTIIKIPKFETKNEWLAVNVVEFYHNTNLIYGCMNENCTCKTCPQMKAGQQVEYLWHDGKEYPKPTRVPAPQYVVMLMNWIEVLLNSEKLFPEDANFPEKFPLIIKKIFKRLFRVYAHLYYYHYSECIKLKIDKHLNTVFKHFMLFVNEHELISSKELKVLRNVINEIIHH